MESRSKNIFMFALCHVQECERRPISNGNQPVSLRRLGEVILPIGQMKWRHVRSAMHEYLPRPGLMHSNLGSILQIKMSSVWMGRLKCSVLQAAGSLDEVLSDLGLLFDGLFLFCYGEEVKKDLKKKEKKKAIGQEKVTSYTFEHGVYTAPRPW